MCSRKLFFTGLIFCMLIACSPALYIPTSENALKAGTQVEELAKGMELYVKYCGGCHNLYLPHRFPKDHWIKEMPEMQQKAKINNEDSEMILKYILAGNNQQ